MNHFFRLMPLVLGILLSTSGFAGASDAALDPGAMLKAAKPGQTVSLPAGTYSTTGLVLPNGVSLRGAGYGKTTITVTGQVGIAIDGGAKSQVSDLTVTDAVNAGILVTKSTGITISRVRVVRCLTGVMASDSTGVRVENVVAAENRTGIALNDCAASSVVNCTLAQNTALGISLGINPNSAVFNSLIVNSPIGVYVSPENTTLALDNNLYLASSVGKCNDILEPNVFVWRDATGYDRHSLSLSLAFADDHPLTYRTTTRLPWAQDRSATSGWGTTKLGLFAAPTSDIDGQPYLYGPCVGSWEVAMTPIRPADGSFMIRSTDGTKSAGLYTKAGKHVAWLFSNLPLKHDTYRYWLPSRDWQGRPLSAGDYELRVAEANLSFKPVGSGVGGNTGVGATRDGLAQISNKQIVYDSKGRTIVDMPWSESGMAIRALAASAEPQRWYFPGPASDLGLASDGQGFLYILRQKGKQAALMCLDEETGHTCPLSDGEYDRYYAEGAFSAHVGGMTILNKTLYVADTDNNQLRTAGFGDLAFAPGIAVPSPTSPCADTRRHLVWVLSAHTNIIAVGEDGKIAYQFPCPIPGAQSIAVNGTRLAVLSYDTGKVHIFDCTDPNHLTAIRTIGTGGDQWGPMQPDRFGFKGAKFDDPNFPLARVAMNTAGDVGVVDNYGIEEFAADGTVKRNLVGGWFNSMRMGMPNDKGEARVLDPTSSRTYLLDAKTKSWRPEAQWNFPGGLIRMFDYRGKHYGLFTGSLPAKEPTNAIGPIGAPYNRTYYCIADLDEKTFVAKPVIAYSWQYETTVLTDFRAPLNAPMEQNPWKQLVGPDGKPINFTNGAPMGVFPSGDAYFDYGTKISTIHLLGVDVNGVPMYDWLHPKDEMLTVDADDKFISPYDFKTKESVDWAPGGRIDDFMKDGSLARPIDLGTGRVEGLIGGWSGTDLAFFNPAGKLQWLQTLTDISGVEGGYAVGDFIYTVHATTSETEVFAKDGMFLGRIGQPKGLPWGGKWLDNGTQFAPFLGNDGKHYMVYGDFNECCFYWMSVDGIDRVVRQRLPVHIDDSKSTELAAQPLPEAVKPISVPITRIKIAKLAAPMTMDGSLEKWRAAVPTPQVIVTPDSASPGIKGPADCSALVRFAHENGNLYVQVIKFDDLIVMDNPVGEYYLQDGVELSINSFISGFKFNVSQVKDLGDIILRDRFYNTPPSKLLDPAKAPRKIIAYDNAKDFPERKLIENLYGIDMSACKVLVMEFKIPLNADTYENDVKAVPESTSGSSIWLGMLIDDNDIKGGDVQNYELWPSTYGTFSAKEAGAIGTFE